MRAVFTLLLASLLVSSGRLSAQQGVWVTDSVSMGAPAGSTLYPLDVFYSLKNSTQKSDSNAKWHLAFEMSTFSQGTNVSILANYAQTGIQVWSANKAGTASFASMTINDTAGGKTAAALALYNNPNDLEQGALNRNKMTSGPNAIYDFGWGKYNTTSHNVEGDSVYFLKVGPAYYKMWVQGYIAGTAPGYDSISYTFRIASLTGAAFDRTLTVRRSPNYMTSNFAYYNILTDTWYNREPATTSWDMAFTRYGDSVYMGPTAVVYPSTGILSNKKMAAVRFATLTPDTTGFKTFAYSMRTNVIGTTWKHTTGSGPTTMLVLDTASYFVKSNSSQEYYLIQFKRFDGSGTGKTVLQKMLLGNVDMPPTNVVGTASAAALFFTVVPNPATAEAGILVDATVAGSARVLVTDLTGRTLQAFPAELKVGLNAFRLQTASLPAGMYLVTVAGNDWKQTQQLLIQH